MEKSERLEVKSKQKLLKVLFVKDCWDCIE